MKETPATRKLNLAIGRAVELLNAKRHAEAEALLLDLRKQHAFNPYILFNLGVICFETKRMPEAIRWYRLTVGADPDFLPGLVNLGNILQMFGQAREGLRYMQMALRRDPDNPGLLSNLARTLASLGEGDHALQAVDHALTGHPHHLNSLVQRMTILLELGRKDAAKQAALVAWQHCGGKQAQTILLTLLSAATGTSDWDMAATYKPLLETTLEPDCMNNPLSVAFFTDEPSLLGRLGRNIAASQDACPRPARTWQEGRITVGYLSPDFREHPVSQMLLEVFRHHDRSRVRIVTLGILPLDESPLCRAIMEHVDEHLDLMRMDDQAASDRIRACGVDVLVDLAGTSQWGRSGVLAHRPCPAQILWLGCPATTGMPFYDGFLLDQVVAPPGMEEHCVEPLIRLPCCYHPISRGIESPRNDRTRADYGLPSDRIIVGLLQQAAKIHPPFIDRIASTLARHPEAVLWLRIFASGRDKALERLERCGLPGNRVIIAPLFNNRADYLAAYRQVDFLIDTQPYGGHSTTGEALVDGTPVVTSLGRSIHARVAGSMLSEFGLGDLVAADEDTLFSTVDQLLDSSELRTIWKRRFATAAQTYAANGVKRLTRALEDAYEQCLRSAPPPSSTPA